MKEIITLQLGKCGNSMGASFWEELCAEHGLQMNGYWCGESFLQLQGIDCFFTDGGLERNYVPRCLLIDLDPTSLESIRMSRAGQLFRPDNFILGKQGSGNNFSYGRFGGGRDIQDVCCEIIRKEVENSDWPVGFQMLSALGGGTGSGVACLLLDILKDEYPKMVLTNHTIFPGGGFCSDAVVEPLNAVLAAPSFINSSDITVCMDNQRLYEICENTLKLTSPLYSDVNEIVAKVITGLTATYRFPSKQHVSLGMMKCLLVPSPHLHFFVPGYAPLNCRGVQQYRNFSVQDITYQMLFGKDCLLGPGVVTPNNSVTGKYLTTYAVYRGYSVTDKAVNNLLSAYQENNLSNFCPWMPFHFVKGICQRGNKLSAACLVNHTGPPRHIWGNILKKFRNIFKRKAFLHWYYNEGQNSDDFRLAEESIRGLLDEYKSCEANPPNDWEGKNKETMFKVCRDNELPIKIEEPRKKGTCSFAMQ